MIIFIWMGNDFVVNISKTFPGSLLTYNNQTPFVSVWLSGGIGEAQQSDGCSGSDQSAPHSPYKMTLTRLLLCFSLASLAKASPVVVPPPDCQHHWWLGSDGQPTQNLHCGQLFSGPSTTTLSPTKEANQRCSEDEFLCGDGSTCLPFSRLCDEVGECITAFHVSRSSWNVDTLSYDVHDV